MKRLQLLDVTFEVALARALERDIHLFGSSSETRARYEARYIPGQRLYLAQCRPKATADILIDNNNLDNPEVIRLSAAAAEEDLLRERGLAIHDHH